MGAALLSLYDTVDIICVLDENTLLVLYTMIVRL
jgi:hypothetical protein